MAFVPFFCDYAAGTPTDPEIAQVVYELSVELEGNPGNLLHPQGRKANAMLEDARLRICQALQADTLVFTASATESNHLAVMGALLHPRRRKSRNVILLGATEHSSLYFIGQLVEKFDPSVRIVHVPVDANGQLDCNVVAEHANSSLLLASFMDVNNETGIIQKNLATAFELVHQAGALTHCDAAQGFARGNFLTRALPWDMLTLSSAKIYGPKGAAALLLRYERQKPLLAPLFVGSGYEQGLRASTPNVPACVGFAVAVEKQDAQRIARNSLYLEQEKAFLSALDGISLHLVGEHGSAEGIERVPGLFMLLFSKLNAIKLAGEVEKHVAFGLGSACSTQNKGSRVLAAMGYEQERIATAARFSFGKSGTASQAFAAGAAIRAAALRLLEGFS